MVKNFNLLISTSRGNENKCASELWFLFREIGVSEQSIERTDFSGLLVAKVDTDPFKVINALRERVSKKPWDIRYVLKITPIEIVVNCDLKKISEAAQSLAHKIGEEERYRVTVNKRGTSIKSSEIIEAAAKVIDRKVDLRKPDKILLIEVLGDVAGISVVREHDILSIVREKEKFLKGE